MGIMATITTNGRNPRGRNSIVSMVRKFLVILFLFSCSLMCLAHAGMFDDYLRRMVSVDAVVLTIAVAQIVCYLLIRSNWFKAIKRVRKSLLLFAKKLHRNGWLRLLAAWGLSSFALSPYIVIACNWLWILGILLFLVFWLFYLFLVLYGKTRRAILTGIKPLYLLLVASIGEIIGGIVYCTIYEMEWFRSITYYTDEEYALSDFKLFPTIDGVWDLWNEMKIIFFFFAIPYVLLIAIRVFKELRK